MMAALKRKLDDREYPELPQRKKNLNQSQRDFENLLNSCPSEITDAANLVVAKIKALSYKDEENEFEKLCQILKISLLEGSKSLEEYPNGITAVHLEVAKGSKEGNPMLEELEKLVTACKEITSVYFKSSKILEIHESTLYELFEKFECLTREAANQKHEAEDYLSRVSSRHEELINKATELDNELETQIHEKSPRRQSVQASSKHLSMTLDVIQSGDPRIAALLRDRKQTYDMEQTALEELEKANKELSYRKAVCVFCEVCGANLETNSTLSRTRARQNRGIWLDQAFHAIKLVLPALTAAINSFGTLQRERQQNASEKLHRTRFELNEHNRLFQPDEATSDRTNMEQRINEFEEIIKRSKQAISNVIKQQVDLWNEPCIPVSVKNYVQLHLGPMIRRLPFSEENINEGNFFKLDEGTAMKSECNFDEFFDDVSSISTTEFSQASQVTQADVTPVIDIQEEVKDEGGGGCVIM